MLIVCNVIIYFDRLLGWAWWVILSEKSFFSAEESELSFFLYIFLHYYSSKKPLSKSCANRTTLLSQQSSLLLNVFEKWIQKLQICLRQINSLLLVYSFVSIRSFVSDIASSTATVHSFFPFSPVPSQHLHFLHSQFYKKEQDMFPLWSSHGPSHDSREGLNTLGERKNSNLMIVIFLYALENCCTTPDDSGSCPYLSLN